MKKIAVAFKLQVKLGLIERVPKNEIGSRGTKVSANIDRDWYSSRIKTRHLLRLEIKLVFDKPYIPISSPALNKLLHSFSIAFFVMISTATPRVQFAAQLAMPEVDRPRRVSVHIRVLPCYGWLTVLSHPLDRCGLSESCTVEGRVWPEVFVRPLLEMEQVVLGDVNVHP